MKNQLFICLLLLLASCSDKDKAIDGAAAPPALHFDDTLYIREKDPLNINQSGKGVLFLYCTPIGHQFNLSFSDTSGRLHFIYRGAELKDSKPFVVTENSNQVFCYADRPGVYAVDFYLTDQLGRTTTKQMMVKCAAQGKPHADYSWKTEDRGNDNWLCTFDASPSKQPFGQVMTYHYLFEKDTVQTAQPLMHYFIHGRGVYNVGFYVTDDLGINSDTLYRSIDIP